METDVREEGRKQKQINVLIVDDNPLDAELSQMELRRAHVNAHCVVATNEAELLKALETFVPDITLCDFAFPGFDGFAAQRIVKQKHPAAPLIFVSGTISEDRAVMALQTGAVDYVMKSNLLRLPSAVEHAVREAEEHRRLEESLRESEALSRLHAERLEGLWNIVNNPKLRDRELFLAMLSQAAATIRPGQGFRAILWRQQDTDLVVEAVTENPENPDEAPADVGLVVPLGSTIIGRVIAEGGGTRAWDDVTATDYASTFATKRQTHTLVVTTFAAGGSTWGLAFASHRTTTKPLGPQDRAYVEVLASFFANHVQQRWQFDRIQYQQSHDVLTGLLNRSQFRSQARLASLDCSRFAVIILDINDFRAVNSSYGHMIGDALLVEAGNAVRRRAAADEIVGRVGGDVFSVFVPNPVSREFVRGRAVDFAEAFARAFSTGDREGKEFIALTASIGVAMAPEDGATIESILSHVDVAVFAAKQSGPGAIVFYEPGMEHDAQRRATLRGELAEAVAQNQFELYYQPHMEIATGIVTGCEALIRWNHPTRGLLLPDTFIPFAEQTGAIKGIDTWVMQNVLAAVNDLSASHPALRVYFNLSGRQAGDSSIVRAFCQAARAGIRLGNVGIEITESDAMRDVETTRHVCRALRRLGIQIAIDDFGTGYSSLSSLKRLPVDIVKIDGSFISGVLNDRHDATITETIISISQHFGFDSLAEGVEHPAETEWLRQRGCRYIQGYAIAHPLPLNNFKAWLETHAPNDVSSKSTAPAR